MNTPAQKSYLPALCVLTSLFFMWGLITSLNDILIPHLKAAFALSYVEAMLVQFCFFGAYFVMSLPSGLVVKRVGYKRGIVIGLSVAGVGCLLFYPAAGQQSYPLFLGALFVLASGITLLQVAANPYVAILGRPERASSRLTLTQAFNSLGTTIGPYLGSILILSAATQGSEVRGPYVVLALVLFAIAVAFALLHLPKVQAVHTVSASDESVWSNRHLALGAIAIFVYVGAEVSIGSFFVNLASQPYIAGLPEKTAGEHLSYYWGAAMVGRFIGAFAMLRIKPGRLLAFNACMAIVLLIVAISMSGKVAMWSMLAIGLFNSIMFPTIFTLALAGLGKHTDAGSGVLCMAIVGGAIMPVVQGYFADTIGLLYAFVVPVACYLFIVYYGLRGHVATR